MKTWEILKELTENPEKRFKLQTWREGSFVTATNTGMLINEISDVVKISRLDLNWEEVPQEVTWQEALKFWIDGGQIEVWRNDELKYRSRRGYKLGVTKSDERYHFDRKDFTEGKWYIWEGTK